MPTELIQALALEGPSLYGPLPCVALRLRSSTDRSRRLRAALKDAAQGAGMVIGQLEVSAQPQAGEYLIDARFNTPTPALGVALAQYVAEGLNRHEAGDEEWDAEAPLWALQKRRRAEALPLPALQLMAEAAARGVPSLLRADGRVQLGYGARSWAFDPAQLKKRGATNLLSGDEIEVGPPAERAPSVPTPPWGQIGSIPVIGITGGAACAGAARMVAVALRAQGLQAGLALDADFDATRALLADPASTIAVAGLRAAGIAQRGLAIERCAYSAVTDLPALPPEVADAEELARVLGVPMLITASAGCAVLNADVPAIAALAEYAPCPVIFTSASSNNPFVAAQRAHGGAALFVRAGRLVAAHGPTEQDLAPASHPAEELPALALLWAMGLAPPQTPPGRPA